MPNYQQLTPKVFRGRGHAGRAVGVPYNVYRVTSTSTGDYITLANKVSSDFYVLRRVLKGGGSFETATDMKTMFFDHVGDTTTFLIGDVFIQDDLVYGAGDTAVAFPTLQFEGMCLAFNPPIGKKALSARLDRLATIYRPNSAPTSGSQPYFDNTLPQDTPMILTAGVFSFAAGTASNIPVGVMPFPRPSGGMQFKPDVPGLTEFPNYFMYTPPLDGVALREGDRIVTADGERFVVLVPWNQRAGVSGNQLCVRREISGGAT